MQRSTQQPALCSETWWEAWDRQFPSSYQGPQFTENLGISFFPLQFQHLTVSWNPQGDENYHYILRSYLPKTPRWGTYSNIQMINSLPNFYSIFVIFILKIHA